MGDDIIDDDDCDGMNGVVHRWTDAHEISKIYIRTRGTPEGGNWRAKTSITIAI